MKIRATIKGNKITCDKTLWDTYLADNQGEVNIEIKKWTKDRSYDQNRLYWKYLEVICQDTGNESPEELHEYLKRALLPPRFITVLGKTIKVPESTTRLSTVQFTEYITKINSLTGIPIPNYDQI